MVTYGTALVVMGGYNYGSNRYQSSFYQFSCENGIFKWEKMKPELKIPRSDFVAMTIRSLPKFTIPCPATGIGKSGPKRKMDEASAYLNFNELAYLPSTHWSLGTPGTLKMTLQEILPQQQCTALY